MPLTDVALRRLKPKAKPYKLYDGGGLFLWVQPNGGKWWRYEYRFLGKRKLLALGTYPEVSLAAARESHKAARQSLAANIDPNEAKKEIKRSLPCHPAPMIVVTQIRAARALLGWTQGDLAKAASLSLPAVNNIERCLTTPRHETLLAIEEALSTGGVEFIDQSGVRLRRLELNTQIIEGPNWLKHYDDIIIAYMKGPDDEIVQFSCDEELWMVYGSTTNCNYFHHRNKVHFKERILVPQSMAFASNDRPVYRCHEDALFANTSWQVFGPYVAHIAWMKQQVVLVRSPSLAATQRAMFEMLWRGAKPLTDAQWKKMKKWHPPAKA